MQQNLKIKQIWTAKPFNYWVKTHLMVHAYSCAKHLANINTYNWTKKTRSSTITDKQDNHRHQTSPTVPPPEPNITLSSNLRAVWPLTGAELDETMLCLILPHYVTKKNWKYIMNCTVVIAGQSHGHSQHSQKISWSLDMWFWDASAETDRQNKHDNRNTQHPCGGNYYY